MRSVLTVIGTRPEAIKLAPVLGVLNQNRHFVSKICVTKQHTDLLDSVLTRLGFPIDYVFESGEQGATLHRTAAKILGQFEPIFEESKPDLVIVQGDTTTAFVAALASYYSCIPIAHVEAGLRTGQLYSPWPEEVHRSLIARMASYCFAPTENAKQALISEGISPNKIWVVGNTSIDAIRLTKKPLVEDKVEPLIVVTVHRRENHGNPILGICQAIRKLANEFPAHQIKFLLHPNPAVRLHIEKELTGFRNVKLLQPLDHSAFIHLLQRCQFIITDSGGIQEEATYMGKPVLIVRDTTERPEGIDAGTAQLVGTDSERILACCRELIKYPDKLAQMSKIHYPYGDGYAADRIVTILQERIC